MSPCREGTYKLHRAVGDHEHPVARLVLDEHRLALDLVAHEGEPDRVGS